MPILESSLVGGVAFFFGWLFGNSRYGQVNLANSLKKDNVLQLAITEKDSNKKSGSPRRVSGVLTIEDVKRSYEEYRQAVIDRPTDQEDLHKLTIADELREKAATHALSSRGYFADSRKCAKDVSQKAKNLLTSRGTIEENFMEECNAAASAIYFRHFNPNYSNSCSQRHVDVSKLQLKEVLRYVETIMQKELKLLVDDTIDQEVKKNDIVFIISTGIDTKWTRKQILLTVEKYLSVAYDCSCVIDIPDKGCLWVQHGCHARSQSHSPVKYTSPIKEINNGTANDKMPPKSPVKYTSPIKEISNSAAIDKMPPKSPTKYTNPSKESNNGIVIDKIPRTLSEYSFDNLKISAVVINDVNIDNI